MKIAMISLYCIRHAASVNIVGGSEQKRQRSSDNFVSPCIGRKGLKLNDIINFNLQADVAIKYLSFSRCLFLAIESTISQTFCTKVSISVYTYVFLYYSRYRPDLHDAFFLVISVLSLFVKQQLKNIIYKITFFCTSLLSELENQNLKKQTINFFFN